MPFLQAVISCLFISFFDKIHKYMEIGYNCD